MQHREVPRAVHRLKNLFPLFLVEFVTPARSDQKFWFSTSYFPGRDTGNGVEHLGKITPGTEPELFADLLNG